MLKLLNESFFRLIKSKTLYILAAFVAVAGVVFPVTMRVGGIEQADNVFFMYASAVPFVAALFVSVFVGTEYGDGAIRNKLVCGHSRVCVYLSGLITSIATVFALIMVYTAISAGVSVPLMGAFASGSLFMKNLVCTVLTGICYTCIFTTVCYLVSGRVASTIACFLTGLVLLVTALIIFVKLNAPPTFMYVDTDEFGNVIGHRDVSNPQYVAGAARAFCEFLMEFLPGGPTVTISFVGENINYGHVAIYMIVISIVAAATGAVLFRIKDIK